MALIKGKQIATGADGIDTPNLKDGLLSADAAGRAKIATSFFDASTVSDKFATTSIALDRLAEAVIQADGGQAFTGDQSMGSHKITGLSDGAAAGDAVNKGQLDSATAGSSNWKELLLIAEQLLAGSSGGILQAILGSIYTLPVSGQTFIITDGTTVETFTFLATETAPFDVAIGSTVADSMTNLAQAINDDSTAWSALHTTGLDKYFALSYTDQIVIYRTATSTNADRVYGFIKCKVVEFATGTQNYQNTSGTEGELSTVDPASKLFGFGRAYANLIERETHTEANLGESYNWDSDDEVWNQITAGGVQAGQGLTKTAGNTLNVGAGKGIQVNADDVDVLYGTTPTTIQPDDSASAGTTDEAARIDHKHAISAGAAGNAQVGSTAAEGSSTDFARADHVHGFTAGTPVDVGSSNGAGSATTFSRSDHVHAAPTYTTSNKEMACNNTTSDGDQATATTVASTPALNSYVKVEVNGLGYVVGDGVKTKDCYFSNDGGTTARSITAIASGDTCHWNGSIAGFQLSTSDIMDWFYLA